MRRYTETRWGWSVGAKRESGTRFTAWWVASCKDGTTYEGSSDDLAHARTLPLRIAREEVQPVPVTDAKGRRVKR